MNNTYFKHKVTNQIVTVESGFNWKVFLFGPLYGENAHIDPPVALQTDHPKLLFS